MKKLLIIMLGVFIFTPLSLKAVIYDSNDEPISDLRFYTLNEVFNKVERPLSNYIITQDPNFDILNYTNFIGLNGHSLREVFEVTELNTILNEYGTLLSKYNIFISNNKTYYGRFNLQTDNSYNEYFGLIFTWTSEQIIISGQNYNNVTKSFKYTVNNENDTTLNILASTDGNAQLNNFILIELDTLGIDNLTVEQMDYWFSVYQNPNLLNGLEIMDSNELFFYKDTIFNISKMKADKIFSSALSTFDSLTENQMLSQFEQWEYRDFNKVKVLSYNDYLFFNPDGTLQSMLSYYDNYNLNLKNVEASINEIDKNEIIILLTALIAYIIGVIISIYFRNNVLFAGSSLLWFIPVFMIPNMFIITFSIIMIIMSFVITFYNNKEEGFN